MFVYETLITGIFLIYAICPIIRLPALKHACNKTYVYVFFILFFITTYIYVYINNETTTNNAHDNIMMYDNNDDTYHADAMSIIIYTPARTVGPRSSETVSPECVYTVYTLQIRHGIYRSRLCCTENSSSAYYNNTMLVYCTPLPQDFYFKFPNRVCWTTLLPVIICKYVYCIHVLPNV